MDAPNSNRLRNVLRRAVIIARNIFKDENLIQTTIIPKVIETLGDTYPELQNNYDTIVQIIAHDIEAEKLLKDKVASNLRDLQIDYSIIGLEEIFEHPQFISAFEELQYKLKYHPATELSGEEMLKIHNRFNLDEEFIVKLAQTNNLTPVTKEFQLLLAKQKSEEKTKPLENLNLGNNVCIEKTVNLFKYVYVYDKSTKLYNIPILEAKILAIVKDNNEKDLYHVIMDKSNFYHTSGGQDGDTGKIIHSEDKEKVFIVEKVQCINDLVIHSGKFCGGNQDLKVSDPVSLHIDAVRRTSLVQHHTGTYFI